MCVLESQQQNQTFSHALCPFVAVMEKIREHVRSNFTGSQENVVEDVKHEVEKLVESSKMDKFMRDKHRHLRELLADDVWLERFRFRANVTSSDFHPRCVTFHRFHKEIWVGDQGILAKLRSKHDASLLNQLSPIVVFSNIRTFIKGGVKHLSEQIEPEQGLLPLSKEEYLEVHENDCAVPEHLRELIYKAYLHYDDHMRQHRLWDDADLDADVFAMVAHICRRSRLEKSEIHTQMLFNEHRFGSDASEHNSSAKSVRALSYDRIFVDECQDMSPGKSVVFHCTGRYLSHHLFSSNCDADIVMQRRSKWSFFGRRHCSKCGKWCLLSV